jgi:hypothetical protein
MNSSRFEKWMLFLTMLGTVISALALVFAAVFGLQQLYELREQIKEARQQAENARVKESRERALTYSLARNPEVSRARERLRKVFPEDKWKGKTIPLADLKRAMSKKSGEEGYLDEGDLRLVLNYYEEIALTVCAQATDVDFAFETIGSLLVMWEKGFHDYIADEQKMYSPRIYMYLGLLAESWQQRLDERKKKGLEGEPLFKPPS